MKKKKKVSFSSYGIEVQKQKSRDTGVTGKFGLRGQNEADLNRVLSRERTGHSKHPFPVTQETTLHMDITRCQYRNQIDYILCS